MNYLLTRALLGVEPAAAAAVAARRAAAAATASGARDDDDGDALAARLVAAGARDARDGRLARLYYDFGGAADSGAAATNGDAPDTAAALGATGGGSAGGRQNRQVRDRGWRGATIRENVARGHPQAATTVVATIEAKSHPTPRRRAVGGSSPLPRAGSARSGARAPTPAGRSRCCRTRRPIGCAAS